MHAMSTEAWHDQLVKQAQNDFKDHVLKTISPVHWRIRRPNSGMFWADIVIMGNAGIGVWGDIEGCFFAYGSGAPEDIIAWMARADVEYYGRQKASIGMNGAELVDEYVGEVALYDLRQHLVQAKDEYDPEEWNRQRPGVPSVGVVYEDAIRDAERSVRNGENMCNVHGQLIEDIQDIEPDAYEWVNSVGKVTSCRVIYALVAVRKLWELLNKPD